MPTIDDSLYKRLLSPATMVGAEGELLAGGAGALPVLEALLNGEAKNRFGVSYRQLGLPLTCALEVARRLGPIARPLERYFREELQRGNRTAAMALRSLGGLEEASIAALAASLDGDALLATEGAAALIECGAAGHPPVVEAVARSERAARVLARVRAYLDSERERKVEPSS